MSQYDELKRLAEAANAVTGDTSVDITISSERGPNQLEIDAVTAFVASATPAAVLALIAENERLSGECEGCPMQVAEELRAENAGLHTGYKAYEQVNAELRAEVEALRKALTYIRDTSDDWHVCEKAADALADAAMAQGEQS